MRIRKHAKLSSLLYATSSAALQPHVCQLNQSPWDVMAFSPPSTPLSTPPPPLPSQVIENGDSAVNGSSRDSVSVAKWEEEYDDVSGRKWGLAEKSEEGRLVVLCSKTDGKNWQCGREAINGNSISMCDHHLSIARSYCNSSNSSTTTQSSNNKKAAVVAEVPKRRARPKKASSVSTSSNPYEFYYYSGFGPRWGKKRGEDKDNSSNGNASKISHENDVDKPASSSQFIDQDLDYIYDDDDDDHEEEVLYERKRARKPVKARSLKSLM